MAPSSAATFFSDDSSLLNGNGAASMDGTVTSPDSSLAASPGSGSGSASGSVLGPRTMELELQRKRARDRKSQQAMRDRTKWTITNLSDQVAVLSTALDQRSHDLAALETRTSALEAENAQLRTQNAALQLSLMGRRDSTGAADETGHSPGSVVSSPLQAPLWELCPKNTPPTCMADQILQGFVDTIRASGTLPPPSSREQALRFPLKPNLSSLLDRKHTSSNDEISNVVADVLRTYKEIEGLPKQVAVFYVMSTLLKWMVLLDKHSWELMPEWLRPTSCQLSTPHAAWVDRIPWPRARDWLIAHPEVTLDHFVPPYSSGFKLNWPYDPASVLLDASINHKGAAEIAINPVYEEHLRQIRHWTVGDAFRSRFPELSQLIDMDSGQVVASTPVDGYQSLGSSPQTAIMSQHSPP